MQLRRPKVFPIFGIRDNRTIFSEVFAVFKVNPLSGFKKTLYYTLLYWLPRVAGFVLTPIKFFLGNRYFLRLDLDHFGPIIYLDYFINSSHYNTNNHYYVMSYQFPNKELMKHFPGNITFIEASLKSYLFCFLFFIKDRGLLIFPHYENFTRFKVQTSNIDFSPLSMSSTERKPLLANKVFDRPDWLRKQIGDSAYVMLFNREPGCAYTAGVSNRNMDLSSFQDLIEFFDSEKIYVVRYGGEYMRPAADYGISSNYLIDYTASKRVSDKNDVALWANTAAIIGSSSGAVHVPNVIFGIPALVFSLGSLERLIQFCALDQLETEIPTDIFWALDNSIFCPDQNSKVLNSVDNCIVRPPAYQKNYITDCAKLFLRECGVLSNKIPEHTGSKPILRATLHSKMNGNLELEYIVQKNSDGRILMNYE